MLREWHPLVSHEMEGCGEWEFSYALMWKIPPLHDRNARCKEFLPYIVFPSSWTDASSTSLS